MSTAAATACCLRGGPAGSRSKAAGARRSRTDQALARVYGVPNECTRERNQRPGRLARQRGPREIRPSDLPRNITFGGRLQPRTVKEVHPRDRAASFGPGVRLHRAAIEVTGNPLTESATDRAPPWTRRTKGYLEGSSTKFSNRRSNTIDTTDIRMTRH